MDMGMMSRNDSNQFWPLEHPIEPLDGPVKCPTLISPSLINVSITISVYMSLNLYIYD